MQTCPITDLSTMNFRHDGYYYRYEIEFNEDKYSLSILSELIDNINSTDFKNYTYLIAGAIFDGQLIKLDERGNKCCEIGSDWKEKLLKIIHPKRPKEKIDKLLKTLYELQDFDCSKVNIKKKVQVPAFWYKHYFKNPIECYNYLSFASTLSRV